jgi:hypothetical protein
MSSGRNGLAQSLWGAGAGHNGDNFGAHVYGDNRRRVNGVDGGSDGVGTAVAYDCGNVKL